MPAVPLPDLDRLLSRRVLFGHQSVGANILEGVVDLLREAGRDWPIVDVGAGAGTGGALLHARVGRNEQPLTKCADFVRLLDEGRAPGIEVALLKFCYIDVSPTTDVAGLFDRYRTTLDELSARHPPVTFVPVTVPLRHAEGGFGVWAREMLGRQNRAKAANLARQQFNQRLRQAWSGRPLFDLAAAEATNPAGQRETTPYDGGEVENLVAAYTDDGGHLNAAGRRVVAAAFLRTLAALP